MAEHKEWNQAEIEFTTRPMINEITEKELLPGDVVVLEYDREKGEVLFAAFTGGLAVGKSFLITPKGSYSGGYRTYRPSMFFPVTEKEDMETCEQLLEIVRAHDPKFGRKLSVVSQPQPS